MNTPDSTPTPVEVDVESSRSVDSSRQFSVELGREAQVGRSRGLLRKLLVPATIAGVMFAPMVHDDYKSNQREELSSALAEKAETPQPLAFQVAESRAAQKLFGTRKGEGPVHLVNTEDARTVADETAKRAKFSDWQLDATQLVDPKDAKISEDGKSVEIDGQSYSFAQVKGKEGSMYVVAGRAYEEDRLLSKGRTHMVSPVLVGGAKFEEGLDREELLKRAYAQTRENLSESFHAANSKVDDVVLASQR